MFSCADLLPFWVSEGNPVNCQSETDHTGCFRQISPPSIYSKPPLGTEPRISLEPSLRRSRLAAVGVWGVWAKARNQTMAGRFQGYHYFPSKIGSIEIYWRADGWYWRSRSPGRPPESEPVGPFMTSTEAYLNASGGAVLMPPPASLNSRAAATK
jgi:hypothetical protein